MVNFTKLIHNEVMKIHIQKPTWIMYAFLAILILATGILTFTMDDIKKEYSESGWRTELKEENEKLTKEMEEDHFFQDINMSMIAENNYYLDHNMEPANYSAWHFVWENELLLSLVSLFTIIVASGVVANEFRWGTIKLLLIRPITRTTILLAKFIAVLLFALFMFLFVIAFSWIVGALIFGFEGFNPHIVIDKGSGLEYVSIIGEVMTGYSLKTINLVMMATFAFMISCIFRNSGLAIGLAVFLMMAGNSIVMFFSDYKWAKYILFANTDLSQYINASSPMMEGMTLTFSVVVLLIYFVIFLIVSWGAFTKRDVAGQ